MNRTRMLEEHAATRFASDIEKHEMKIVLDDGLYRHLSFRQPDRSFYWFEVVTWPHALCIRGDMGTYVFSRLHDMFEFFRGERVNPQYWAEKVVSGKVGVEEYSAELAKQMIMEHVSDEYLGWRDFYKEEVDQIRDEVRDRLLHDERLDWNAAGPAHEAISDFQVELPLRPGETKPQVFRFEDAWDWGTFEEYTVHFLWCLNAIVHAIKAYDAAKVPA